jgi:hypothetical protein
MAATPEQKRANRRLGLTLAAIALSFGVVFMVKMTFFGG